MEWVEGNSFSQYIEQNLHSSENLLSLADEFKRMVLGLKGAGVAHGDLQHGNIIMCGNELRLVDYDGMFRLWPATMAKALSPREQIQLSLNTPDQVLLDAVRGKRGKTFVPAIRMCSNKLFKTKRLLSYFAVCSSTSWWS